MKVELKANEADGEQTIDADCLRAYLRLGFLPSPLALESNRSIVNQYSEFQNDSADGNPVRYFHTFCGRENRAAKAPGIAETTEKLRSLLIESVDKATSGRETTYLMVSGGKDSAAIAWALAELGRKTTLVHCHVPGLEDERKDVESLASRFDHGLIFSDVAGRRAHELYSTLESVGPLPLADPAIFSYVVAVTDIMNNCASNCVDLESSVMLDGMGNDSYMGHVSPNRARLFIKFPEFAFSESALARWYSFPSIHYALGQVGRAACERHWSGTGFLSGRVEYVGNLDSLYSQLKPQGSFLRTCLRGGIYDLDSCIRKGVIAAEIAGPINIAYPYLSRPLVEYFSSFDIDESNKGGAKLNKIALRNLLQSVGVKTEHSTRTKGSFRADAEGIARCYEPSSQVLDALKSVRISQKTIEKLTRCARTERVAAQKLLIVYALDAYLKSKANYNIIKCEDSKFVRDQSSRSFQWSVE